MIRALMACFCCLMLAGTTDDAAKGRQWAAGTDSLQALVAEHPEVLEPEVVKVLQLGDRDEIVVTGMARPSKDQTDPALKRQEALQAADLVARSAMVKFIHGNQVQSSCFISKTVVRENDVKRVQSVCQSVSTSRSEGLVRSAERVAWWPVEGSDGWCVLMRMPVERLVSGETGSEQGVAKAPDAAVQVRGVGRAPVSGGNKLEAERKALGFAKQDALQKGVGTIVSERSAVQNGRAAGSRQDSNMQGVLSRYETVRSEQDPATGDWVVEIDAMVSASGSNADAGEEPGGTDMRPALGSKETGLTYQQSGKFTVAVIALQGLQPSESGLSRGFLRSDSAPLMESITRAFAKANIRITDLQQLMQTIQTQQPEQFKRYEALMQEIRKGQQAGKDSELAAFGALGAADVLIRGETLLKSRGKDADGLRTLYDAFVTLKAVRTGTGETIASITENVVAPGDSDLQAIAAACAKMSGRLEELVRRTMDALQDELNNGRRLMVSVTGLPDGRRGSAIAKTLREGLKDIPGVVQVEQARLEPGSVDFNLMFKGTGTAFLTPFQDWFDDKLGDVMEKGGLDRDIAQQGDRIAVKLRSDKAAGK